MIAAVFDTNVIVSGMLSPEGPPGRIVDWLVGADIRAVVDDRIMAEYEHVLHYPRLQLRETEVDIVMERIFRQGIHATVLPQVAGIQLPHKNDAPFAECAVTAEVPLVTGNIRHFPLEKVHPVPVLSPAEYVKALELARGNRDRP